MVSDTLCPAVNILGTSNVTIIIIVVTIVRIISQKIGMIIKIEMK